jgi:hypothetical protein
MGWRWRLVIRAGFLRLNLSRRGEHENEILEPGTGFHLVRMLLGAQRPRR